MSAPEFSHPIRVETIGDAAQTIAIEADEGERAALAKRFELIALDALTASFTIRRDAQGIVADGRVKAALVQACSVTGDPLPARIDESVALRFVPEGSDEQDEVELADGDLDVIPYAGSDIDLGETAAETVLLALDPFPRGPGAESVLKAAGVIGEDEAKPLGALAGLKDILTGR
ncbi:DUF177 domain-containing protein [Sphingomonas bacterium]|uniref:YceD family protein n=1 Tax=Sphingomonas bacterium TaxID=1895847 RepID=UPI00263464E6|nr:DUF177 domain-containing protein [Sphingomonas bacterium]MDB5677541.1 hypothetical protein [Sphingomonas bacterium]